MSLITHLFSMIDRALRHTFTALHIQRAARHPLYQCGTDCSEAHATEPADSSASVRQTSAVSRSAARGAACAASTAHVSSDLRTATSATGGHRTGRATASPSAGISTLTAPTTTGPYRHCLYRRVSSSIRPSRGSEGLSSIHHSKCTPRQTDRDRYRNLPDRSTARHQQPRGKEHRAIWSSRTSSRSTHRHRTLTVDRVERHISLGFHSRVSGHRVTIDGCSGSAGRRLRGFCR